MRWAMIFMIAIISFVVAGGVVKTAEAKPKPWILGWWPSHWDGLDFAPYLEDPSIPHDRQWDFKPRWNAKEWMGVDGGQTTIQKFFEADILRERDMEDGIPVLRVGPNFYKLSGYDKRRVTDLLDAVHKVTKSQAGYFQIKDDRNDALIGYYDRHGLRLR